MLNICLGIKTGKKRDKFRSLLGFSGEKYSFLFFICGARIMTDYPQGFCDHHRVLLTPIGLKSLWAAGQHLPAGALDYCRELPAMPAGSLPKSLRLWQGGGVERQIMGTKELLRPLERCSGVPSFSPWFPVKSPEFSPLPPRPKKIWKIISILVHSVRPFLIAFLHPGSPSVKSTFQSRTLSWLNP